MKNLTFNNTVNQRPAYTRDVLIANSVNGITLQDVNQAGKIDLSNGISVGQSEYVAPNGVIITSDKPEYSASYGLSYLVDGQYHNGTNSVRYFMSSGSYTSVKVTFDFSVFYSGFHVNEIRIRPKTRRDYISDYRILVSSDGINFTEIVAFVNNTNVTEGTINSHVVNITQKFVQIEFKSSELSYGPTLDEIEFYSPSTSLVQGTPYLALTNELSEDILSLKQMTAVNPVQISPPNTAVRYLVSFDGKKTWETFKINGTGVPTENHYNIVPKISSNNEAEVITSSSGNYSGSYPPFKVFNRQFTSSTDSWRSLRDMLINWIQVQFSKAKRITQYSISTLNISVNLNTYPVDWILQGSNNGVDYTDIHVVTDETNWKINETRFFKVDREKVSDFSYYRLYINKTGPGVNYVTIGGFELMEGYTTNWEKVELSEIANTGMTDEQLQAITPAQWQQKFGTSKVNFAVSLQSFDGIAKPSLKEIVTQSGMLGLPIDEASSPGTRMGDTLQGHFQVSILNGVKFYGIDAQGKVLNHKSHGGGTAPIESAGTVRNTVQGTYQSTLYQISQTPGFTNTVKTSNGITLTKQIGKQISISVGVFQPSIYFGVNLPGYTPVNKTHIGIRYGVGWEEKPPFKPRVLPNEWHPAVYNGQKNNSQPLNE
ncbi:discoidin domain-containing protein [Solibacillus silvestris]